MTSALLIANTSAGSADDDVLDEVVAALRSRWDVEVARTAKPDELRDVLASHTDTDVVVAAGGDGSWHAVVQALHSLGRLPEQVVALVPMGTGNDFARTLGLPDDPVDAARGLLDAEPQPLDLAVDKDGAVVVNAVHVGVGALAGEEAGPWKRRLGPLGYAVGAVKAGLVGAPERLRVVVDGRLVDHGDDVVQAAVGIGRYVGGGAPLLPDADPSDGLLDITISHADALPRRLAYGLRLLRGRHTERDDVVSVRGREVTISGDAMTWNADGEVSDGMRTRTWRIEQAGYRMLVSGPDKPTQDE
ncbi:YegS/Rv2252/BmrU family lipid kinase [Mumia sp. ZJ430]|uniref:diacylglycerol/lipid kinase family protein n=1 Tax=Mumia sp. ZJ430 TaxID=2708083 RepID=UPI0014240436|nr:YegS/Rv2252/BmrU family lipid kinase [Mumia sp. ZJ430]